MKVFKNLFGNNNKIHSTAIYFDFGSNSRGFYLKISDQVMLCWYSTPGNHTLLTWVFPKEFKENPVVLALPTNNTNFSMVPASKTNKQVDIQSSSRTYFNLFAIGII
jgi:predicted cupin superfamily sugar epimerase